MKKVRLQFEFTPCEYAFIEHAVNFYINKVALQLALNNMIDKIRELQPDFDPFYVASELNLTCNGKYEEARG